MKEMFMIMLSACYTDKSDKYLINAIIPLPWSIITSLGCARLHST